MTNKERYKQAFSALHVSQEMNLEGAKMAAIGKQKRLAKMVAGVAAFVFVFGGSVTAYAADVGGIQRTVQLWIQGDKTEAILEYSPDGSYSMEYVDAEGNRNQQGGGGVAIENDGSERPVTEEEMWEHLSAPEVEYKEDGSVWLYYYDQKMDITDKFEDDICYVQVANGTKVLYVTIQYQNGWATSKSKYPDPSTFNQE